MRNAFHIETASVYPLGVYFVPAGLHISAVFSACKECGILLWDGQHPDGVRIPFPENQRIGNVYSMLLRDYAEKDFSYLLYQDEKIFRDPEAKALLFDRKYGEKKDTPCRCKAETASYDWKGDTHPAIPFEDSIFYMLHVRGFTKHRSSDVRHKGTYLGLTEKIPYLKELGITGALLMPAYEFDEILPPPHTEPESMEEAAASFREIPADTETFRINYWGYQEGLYYMPKYAYAAGRDAVREFKDMVRAFHAEGMEVLMQFYFPETVPCMRILEILRYWVLQYHVDGFHLMGLDLPLPMLRTEPLFSQIKIIGEKEAPLHQQSAENDFRNYGLLNGAFLYDTRHILKGDGGMIERLMHNVKCNRRDVGVINYIAKQDGMRLMDLVSFDMKHNEANGESNRDGTDENISWNCGVEGKTRKKQILALRMRQMKNALTFLFLSQGTPLLYGGDEFGNSQEGNNNPYCQDNAITWVKWTGLSANQELFDYTKALIALRKKTPILHAETPLSGLDFLSCGYPDLSFHGRDAWQPDVSPMSRTLGILYCGRYGLIHTQDELAQAKAEISTGEEQLFYIAVNMHWEAHAFGLPQPPKGWGWRIMSDTNQSENPVKKSDQANDTASNTERVQEPGTESTQDHELQQLLVMPRSIVICDLYALPKEEFKRESQKRAKSKLTK